MANETVTFRPSKENPQLLAQLAKLAKQDNRIIVLEAMYGPGASSGVVEMVSGLCPLASAMFYQSMTGNLASDGLAHKDYTTDPWQVIAVNAPSAPLGSLGWVPVSFGKFYINCSGQGYIRGYEYSPRMGL